MTEIEILEKIKNNGIYEELIKKGIRDEEIKQRINKNLGILVLFLEAFEEPFSEEKEQKFLDAIARKK